MSKLLNFKTLQIEIKWEKLNNSTWRVILKYRDMSLFVAFVKELSRIDHVYAVKLFLTPKLDALVRPVTTDFTNEISAKEHVDDLINSLTEKQIISLCQNY